MKRKFLLRLFCAVFALSFMTMACQPTKDTKSSQRRSMRGTQYREDSQYKENGYSKLPAKKQYDDGACCPETECCPKSDCEWCKPRCEDTDKPTGIYAPRQPMKKECPECPETDCCDDCGCDDCGCCDPCDSCDPCDECDDCGCCDPCDSCCTTESKGSRKYTREEMYGRDSKLNEQNRNDPRRWEER